MNVRLTKPAQADIEQAARYYEGQNLGLGVRFLDSLERTIDRIAQTRKYTPKLSKMCAGPE